MSNKNKNFLTSVWTISKDIQTYIEGTILNWLNQETIREAIKTDSLCYLTPTQIVFNGGQTKDFVFYKTNTKTEIKNDRNPNKITNKTYEEIKQVLEICQILHMEKDNNFVMHNDFKKYIKNFVYDNLEHDELSNHLNNKTSDYISEKILSILNKYVEGIDYFYKKTGNNILSITNLNEFWSNNTFTDSEKEIMRISEQNWMNSLISTMAYIVGEEDENRSSFDLIKTYINTKVDDSKKHWIKFCNFCAINNKEKFKEIVDKFIKATQIQLLDIKKNKLYYPYKDNLEKLISVTSEFNSIPNDPTSKEYKVSDEEPFVSKIWNLTAMFDFSFVKKSIEIPLYQRNYSWNDNLVETLINDIETTSLDQNEYHLLGSITFTQIDDDIKIVDGQQRIMTLILTAYSLYKLILYHNSSNHQEEIIKMPSLFKRMFHDKLGWMSKNCYKNSDSYKHLHILLSSDIDEIKKYFPESIQNKFSYKIKHNLDYIWTLLIDKLMNKKEKILAFTKAFFERIWLDVVFVHKKYEEKLFEKMNLLSMKLTNIDLVNSLFDELWRSKGLEKFKDKFSNHFYKKDSKTQDNFARNKSDKKKTIDSKQIEEDTDLIVLFAQFVQLSESLCCTIEPKKKDYYSSYIVLKSYIEELHKKHGDNQSEALTEIRKKLFKFQFILARDYNDLEQLLINTYPFDENYSDNNKEILKCLFPSILLTNVSENRIFFPLIYTILNKFKILDLDTDLTKLAFSEIFTNVTKWLFEIERFWVIWKTGNYKGQSFSKTVRDWVSKISNSQTEVINNIEGDQEQINTYSELREAMLKWINNDKSTERILKEFEDDLNYKLTKPKKKDNYYNVVIFRRIELFLSNNLNNFFKYTKGSSNTALYTNWLDYFANNTTWEHFYPQKAKDDDRNDELESVEVKESIGNGVIVTSSDNKAASNSSSKYKADLFNKKVMGKGYKGHPISWNEAKSAGLKNLTKVIEDMIEKENTDNNDENQQRIKKDKDSKFELFKVSEDWDKGKVDQRNKELLALVKDIYSVK